MHENSTDITSYSYDPAKMELVSYDTPNIATMKAQYVVSNGLAGQMFWDVSKFPMSVLWHLYLQASRQLSTDKTGSGSLVSTTAKVFGSLDQTQVR